MVELTIRWGDSNDVIRTIPRRAKKWRSLNSHLLLPTLMTVGKFCRIHQYIRIPSLEIKSVP